jgi:hypothetical protein
MDGILEFFKTPLGMLLIGIGLILFKDNPIIVKILEFLKIKKPEPIVSPAIAVDDEEDDTPDRDDAFVAANVLTEYFENMGDECKEGLEAAKKAGQCLFH